MVFILLAYGGWNELATAASLVSLHHILSGDERSRATRFYFQRDRERYIVGHALLRLLLAHYLASSPEQIRFEDGSHGKPALAPPYKQSGLRFNLSHSGDRVVVGITRGRELGVDVEYMDRRRASLDLASRFFAPPEVENLQALPTEMQLAGFFNCWTRKEAFIKGTGKGLAQGLDTFADNHHQPLARTSFTRARYSPSGVTNFLERIKKQRIQASYG